MEATTLKTKKMHDIIARKVKLKNHMKNRFSAFDV